MGAVRQQPPEELKPAPVTRVRELREEIIGRGGHDLIAKAENRGLGLVLTKVGGDIDLAADAVLMKPRPAWIEELVGAW